MAAFTCSLSADAPCLRRKKRVIIIIIGLIVVVSCSDLAFCAMYYIVSRYMRCPNPRNLVDAWQSLNEVQGTDASAALLTGC